MKKVFWIFVFVFAVFISNTKAQIITLQDKNSTVLIDIETSDGMYSWEVDGIDHMYQQWFWYRTGDMDHEESIDSLGLFQYKVLDADFDPGNDTLILQYGSDDDLLIEVKYMLGGGTEGSHTSDMAETITIYNYSNSSIDISFFQYVDFDLGGDSEDDTAIHKNENTILQRDDETVLGETVVSPQADHWEIGEYSDILDSLEDGSITTLSDSTSPYTGDVTWAWQWDFTISSNGSVIISKDKRISPVPEPATILLVGAGLLGASLLGRKFINKN